MSTNADKDAKGYRFSATNTYLECRRKFVWQYVDNLELKPFQGATAARTGTTLHAGLAELYRGGTVSDAVQQLTLAALEEGMAETPEALMMQGLLRQYDAYRLREDSNKKVVMVEERLEMEVAPGLWINGQADLLLEDEFGALELLDHKISDRPSITAAGIEINRQMATYVLLTQEALGREVQTATLNIIKRTPLKRDHGALTVERVSVYIDQRHIEAHRKHLARVLQEMQEISSESVNSPLVVPHPGQSCSWCPFREACFVQDSDPDAARAILNEGFTRRTDEV